MSEKDLNLNEEGFEVEELDEADLEDVAGGVAEPNNCDCVINNCDDKEAL